MYFHCTESHTTKIQCILVVIQYGISISVWQKYNQSTTKMYKKYNKSTKQMKPNYNENTTKLQPKYNENTIQIQ